MITSKSELPASSNDALKQNAYDQPVLESELDSYDSENNYLGIRHIKAEKVPENHFIFPYLNEEMVDLSEIHFHPYGFQVDTPSARTRILLEGIASLGEYLLAIENGETFKPDLIFGRTDEYLARLAKLVGFTIPNPDSASQVLFATYPEVLAGYKQLLIRLDDGLLSKLEARAEREPKSPNRTDEIDPEWAEIEAGLAAE